MGQHIISIHFIQIINKGFYIVKNSISTLFEQVKKQNPLVHHITNQVTINDCANVTLAIGGSPVMASSPIEVEEMTSIADSLVLNIGTLTKDSVEAMFLAGKRANKKGKPIVFDPVGVGATTYRKQTALQLLKEVEIAVIRGNASEVSALINENQKTRGVDAVEISENPEELVRMAAKQLNTVVVITGEVDYISDGDKLAIIKGGHVNLTKITGTGCMTTSLIGSFLGVTNHYFDAAIIGLSTMCIAGEVASKKIEEITQYGTFKVHLFDCIGEMNAEDWLKDVKLQID